MIGANGNDAPASERKGVLSKAATLFEECSKHGFKNGVAGRLVACSWSWNANTDSRESIMQTSQSWGADRVQKFRRRHRNGFGD